MKDILCHILVNLKKLTVFIDSFVLYVFKTVCISSDVGDIINQLYGETPPPIILVGHRYRDIVSF